MLHTRRSFIQSTAVAALAAPLILPRRLRAAETAPSNLLNMGFIGMGKQNGSLLSNFLWRAVKVRAVCDVDTTRREHALETVRKYHAEKPEVGPMDCVATADFLEVINRPDIDAVCIATPDHWHAIITVAALRAGKDVYCEKPLTHNIHEAIAVMGAVRKYKRVLQTGSMQRSSSEFRVACELVRNGVIGKIESVDCSFGDPGVPCDLPEEAMEPGLDWDRWLGPAPVRPYNSVLSPRGVHNHYPNWRAYREFGGGMVTDWGAHHIDIAQWGLGMDESGPVEARPPAEADAKRGATLVYASGVTVKHVDGFGVHFHGADGEVLVNRGKFVLIRDGKELASYRDNSAKDTSCAAEVAKAEKQFLADAKIRLYKSKSHIDDFLACVASRQRPITSEIEGGHSAICCHLMNQAYYNRQVIPWNPKRTSFPWFKGDSDWLTRDYRAPWKV